MNAKKPFFFALLVFSLGLFFGFTLGTLGTGFRRTNPGVELRERLEQVNRDLGTAIDSQREAAERASRLQAELQGITDYARSIEEGTRRAEVRAGVLEARAGALAEQLNGAVSQSGELADGISRACSDLEESRILLDELGTILLGLSSSGGKEN